MSTYDDHKQLRETIQMWRRVNDSIRNCGYHISNARLFVLEEMITARIESELYGEDKFRPLMMHITMLINEAKRATANAKVIYLFIIEDWLKRMTRMIDENLKECESLAGSPFDLMGDWESQREHQSTLVLERIIPSPEDESLGDIT